MRKFLLFIITILFSLSGYAQKISPDHLVQRLNTIYTNENIPFINNLSRTTAAGDTLALSNIPVGDSSFVLYLEGTNDSDGYLTGTDSANDQAFAERYNINGNDSSVNVIGVLAQFGGTVNPASVLGVTFTIWDQSPPIVVSATYSYNGFPNDILDTLTVPVTSLGIAPTGDTLKAYLFEQPSSTIQSDFFVGYSINYIFETLNGDTIGLATTVNGYRTGYIDTAVENTTTFSSPFGDSTATVLDTVINVQNATLGADNNWYDNYTQNDSILNNLAIFPIVAILNATGIKGVTKNNLTFYGNYPNPAINSTNIKFSLGFNADVSIQIMDMAGHVLNTINQKNEPAGVNIISINTSALPAGNYLYLVRTSLGAGIASEMTVIK